MSIDRRVRSGLERSATVVDPDPRDTLPDVISRGRRHSRSLRASKAMAVILSIVLVAIAAPQVFHALRSERPARIPAPTPTIPPAYREIAGVYTTKLEPASNLLRGNRMVGRWSLALRTDGVLVLAPPASFSHSVSPATFQVTRSRFRTDTLSSNVCHGTTGTYGWAIRGGVLSLSTIHESCAIREAILGAPEWTRLDQGEVTGSPPAGPLTLPHDGSSLEHATYDTAFQPPMQLTISGHWLGRADTSDFVDLSRTGSDSAGGLTFFRIERVYDPTTERQVPLPHDLASWFESHPAVRILTPVTPTRVGGVPATRFDVELAPGWKCAHPRSGCVAFAPLSPGEPDLGWASDSAPKLRARLLVLRVDGAAVVVEVVAWRSQFRDAIQSAEQLLRTVRFR